MKKGFTLTEMLGAIVILAMISLIAFPPILSRIKDSTKKENESVEKLVINSAKSYVNTNKNKFVLTNGKTYCITLQKLVDENLLRSSIIDSNTDKEIDLSKVVKVTVSGGKYNYTYNPSGGCVAN